MEFIAWPKTPRLFRDVTITEKIDGTNAAVIVTELGIGAQSRNRLISPDADNAGFAKWVAEHADFLAATLGPGHHFGEWWGSGIQRGYGLTNGNKLFSLFNTAKWAGLDASPDADAIGLGVVPTLYIGPFDTDEIWLSLERLANFGSVAAPGFDRPEGVCIFHHASRQVFKATLDGDLPKDAVAACATIKRAGNVTPISNGRTMLPRAA